MRVTLVSPMGYSALVSSDGGEFAGGAEFQLLILGKTLRERGHAVSFVVGDFGQPEVVQAQGFQLHKAFKLLSGNRKLRFVPDMWSLRRAIRRSRPDVVNQRATSFYTGQCCRFSHEAGAAFVFTLGIDANCYRDLRGRIPGPIQRLYHWGIEHAEMVLAQTASQRDLFERHYPRKAELLPNMLELPPAREPGDEGSYVLWVGSLSQRKRPVRFVELAEQLPDLPFRIVGGPGAESDHHAEIRRRAEQLPNLEYSGFVPPDRMDEVYRGAKLYVLTSHPDMEGLSNSFLQACTHAVPTVSISVDPDAVISSKGLGVVVGEDGDLAQAVRSMLEDEGERRRAGLAAREHVAANHDVDALATRAEELFVQAIAAQRS